MKKKELLPEGLPALYDLFFKSMLVTVPFLMVVAVVVAVGAVLRMVMPIVF